MQVRTNSLIHKKKDTTIKQCLFDVNNHEELVNYATAGSVGDFIVELIIDKVNGSVSPEKKASRTC